MITPLNRVRIGNALFASTVAAVAASELHRKGYGMWLLPILSVILILVWFMRTRTPVVFDVLFGWLYDSRPIARGTEREVLHRQQSGLILVCGAICILLGVSGFNPALVAGMFVGGCGAVYSYTLRQLALYPNAIVADTFDGLIQTYARKLAITGGRLFIGAAPLTELENLSGLKVSTRRLDTFEAMVMLHVHIGALVQVRGILDPYLKAIADMFSVSDHYMLTQTVLPSSFQPGDRVLLVESPLYMEEVDPRTVTAHILASRGVEIMLVEISSI